MDVYDKVAVHFKLSIREIPKQLTVLCKKDKPGLFITTFHSLLCFCRKLCMKACTLSASAFHVNRHHSVTHR